MVKSTKQDYIQGDTRKTIIEEDIQLESYPKDDDKFRELFFPNNHVNSSDNNSNKTGININFKSEYNVADFGRRIGRTCPPSTVIALIGDLGTGKTTLTKYIAEGLGVEESITSPTFTIVKSYYTGRIPLHHFDVYRLDNEDEFYDIGGEEYFDGNGVCVIEWADLVTEAIPKDALIIEIKWGEGDERLYKCTF